MLLTTPLLPQIDCENFATISPGYVLTKTVALSIDYFTEKGFTGGGGIGYTPGQNKKEQEEVLNVNNNFNIFASVGWRVYRIDYTFSLFVNAGVTMGDQDPAQPFLSTKFLFPIDTKAISFEPAYIFGRGVTGKLSFHFRL